VIRLIFDIISLAAVMLISIESLVNSDWQTTLICFAIVQIFILRFYIEDLRGVK
jgi:hypothetical protein